MEILLVGLIFVAWVHGYYRGRRNNTVVEMSASDLRRELKRRSK